MPLAYGYVRWSTESQEDGDSRGRQEGYIADWLKRNTHRVQFDTSLGDRGFFRDEGKSGHCRESLEGYQLGEFLRLCQTKRIQPGSFLLFENLDRITREHPWEALRLIDSILRSGVVLVQLSPEKEFRERLEFTDIVTVTATAERAYQESDKKRERCGKAWKTLKESAKQGEVMTSNVPGWCVVVGRKRQGNKFVGGTIKADPAKSAVVRRAFDLVLTGKGCKGIAELFNAEKIPTMRFAKRWTESAVYTILTNPSVHGEYRPHTGRMGSARRGIQHTRKPTGEVVANYYPVVIDKVRFKLVQDELARRYHFKGRRGKHVNLFTGMLFDARDGGGFSYRHSSTHPPTLIPLQSKTGAGGEWASFNAQIFEDCILDALEEVQADDVFPEKNKGGKVSALSALHAAKETELREFQAQIDADPRLMKRYAGTATRLEDECEALADQLANAQREAASPLAEAWGEFQGLAKLARDGNDEVRQRCRSAIRRTIESITCLFTGSKMERKAAVRVQLRSGLHRDYLIGFLGRNRHRKNPPPPVICTPPKAWHTETGELDLRDPKHAAIVEKFLNALPIEALSMPAEIATEEPKKQTTVKKNKPAKAKSRTLAKAR